jgi:hypothetical protein
MINVKVTVDADVFKALQDAYTKSPRTIKTFLNRSLLPQYLKRMQQQWTPYPQPRPGSTYLRTRHLQQSWVFAIEDYPSGAEISAGNNAAYARWVIGKQQRWFHAETGWLRVDDEAAALTGELTDDVIDLYFQIMDGRFA